MSARFTSEFVYIFDQNNEPHFVQCYYGAKLDDSYRSDIYLENKKYCVLDLYMTDEVETEGEFLPRVKESQWRDFFSPGSSPEVATILSEAGLAHISASKLVYVYIQSSSRNILEFDGFVSSADGTKDFDDDFKSRALAFASAQSPSPAQQEELVVQWIVEQI